MSAIPMHWAAVYIGKPWRGGARGPDAFYCYGLTQALALQRLGVALPEPAGEPEAPLYGATLKTAMSHGWQRVEQGPPRADDVVLMRHLDGRWHCGYMVLADGRLGVLHADGHQAATGPVGQVVFETLADAGAGGYGRHEFWRYAA